MPDDLASILIVAGAAAIASPIGGLIALWRQPTSLFLSLALGMASGSLLGAIAFDMLPKALELGSSMIALAGFLCGFAAVYLFDLYINRGRMAGPQSDQRRTVEAFHRRRRPRGTSTTVLAGGTSVEELIEGVSIGVGVAIKPDLGLVVALAIMIDNFSEGLSIGELIRSEDRRRLPVRRILGWTGLIGASLFGSALAGWFFLRGLPQPLLGFLFAAGAGAMFYLVATDLLPQAEERQYQQSAALMTGAGFLMMFAVAQLL